MICENYIQWLTAYFRQSDIKNIKPYNFEADEIFLKIKTPYYSKIYTFLIFITFFILTKLTTNIIVTAY